MDDFQWNHIEDAPQIYWITIIKRRNIICYSRFEKIKKSSANVVLIPEFFKSSFDILLPYLEILFNSILETSHFPNLV